MGVLGRGGSIRQCKVRQRKPVSLGGSGSLRGSWSRGRSKRGGSAGGRKWVKLPMGGSWFVFIGIFAVVHSDSTIFER